MTNSVTLPWPPAALRPNASSPGNWRRKFSANKHYRNDCLILCKAACLKPDGNHLSITFHPPDRRRRDLDNMLASAKMAIDAVAETIGVDDYLFSIGIHRAEPVKGGCVIISVEEAKW